MCHGNETAVENGESRKPHLFRFPSLFSSMSTLIDGAVTACGWQQRPSLECQKVIAASLYSEPSMVKKSSSLHCSVSNRSRFIGSLCHISPARSRTAPEDSPEGRTSCSRAQPRGQTKKIVTVKRHLASTNEPQRPVGSVTQPSNARNTNEENNVLLDVARLVDRNITETELRHVGRQKWSTHNKAAVVASIAMLAIVLLMVALVIWREIYAGGAGPGPLCDTNDCLRFAFIVTQSMDHNVDACDDFGTFVCGGARRPQLPS
ncbi:hypothetical protein MRX96_044318 [Rhipicephalus microplus]